MNVWKTVKWVWGFSPIAWLILLSVAIIVLFSLAFDGLGLLVGCVIATLWVLGIAAAVIMRDYGFEIKKYCKDWWDSRPQ